MSVRSEGEQETIGSNKVSALFTTLATDVDDPVERLMVIHEANKGAKEEHKAIGADMLQNWAEFAAPTTFSLAARAYSALKLADRHPVVHNLVISNVPGPPMPLYFAGAQLTALYPLGPIFDGAALNITVLSSNGKVHVARDRVPGAGAAPRQAGREVPRRARRPARGRGQGGREDDRQEDRAEEAGQKVCGQEGCGQEGAGQEGCREEDRPEEDRPERIVPCKRTLDRPPEGSVCMGLSGILRRPAQRGHRRRRSGDGRGPGRR